jgi:hypothetical protein
MISYRDMTFCGSDGNHPGSDCTNRSCFRFLNAIEIGRAEKWQENPPIAFGDFSGDCEYYEPPTHKKGQL